MGWSWLWQCQCYPVPSESHVTFLVFASCDEANTNNGYRARSASLWVHSNLIWQLFWDGNLHGSDMLHATTASSKPSFSMPRRVGKAVVGRGNAGWTTSKSGNPAHARTVYISHSQKRLEEDFCRIIPHVTPMTQSVKGLNWTTMMQWGILMNFVVQNHPSLFLDFKMPTDFLHTWPLAQRCNTLCNCN